jgi:hypothetical protein
MQEPEVIVTTDEAGEEPNELDIVKSALLTGDITLEVDPAAIARRIVEEILEAENVDAAFHERPIWHANECAGSTFELRSVKWFPSGYEQGASVFAAASVVNVDTGEVGVLTTSAYKQLAKLYVLARDHAFPRRVRVTTAIRPTAGGYYPLDFEDAPAPKEA